MVNGIDNIRRYSITSGKLLEDVTMEELQQQALAIVKSRAREEKPEQQNENVAPIPIPNPRAGMTRRFSGLTRSLSNSFNARRDSFARQFSMSSHESQKPSSPPAELPPPSLTREQDIQSRQALHFRLFTILTTTINSQNIASRLLTLYMTPDFSTNMFDELLSLRILESIVAILSPTSVVPTHPCGKRPPKLQDTSEAFQDARKNSQEHTNKLWHLLTKSRASKGEKEPCPDLKTKLVALGIMALLWPRGVMELGFRDVQFRRCERDSWAFTFCRRPTKDTLGCGLYTFLRCLGMWEEDREQPQEGDLRQNLIDVKDFALTTSSMLR